MRVIVSTVTLLDNVWCDCKNSSQYPQAKVAVQCEGWEMRLKVLGAYGASDAEHNLTGYLIDDWLAVDAGTLTSKLSFAQQARIQAVFITHTHADHIRDLPH